MRLLPPALPMLRLPADLLRVLLLLPAIERGRKREGPLTLLPRLRASGNSAGRRGSDRRLSLQRAIGIVDRVTPGGPNCYRRALLEIALSADAAQEPLHLGFRPGGGAGSGHAWLGDRRDRGCSYPAELSL